MCWVCVCVGGCGGWGVWVGVGVWGVRVWGWGCGVCVWGVGVCVCVLGVVDGWVSEFWTSGIDYMLISWVVPKLTPPGAPTPYWATPTHGHPGTKLRHWHEYSVLNSVWSKSGLVSFGKKNTLHLLLTKNETWSVHVNMVKRLHVRFGLQRCISTDGPRTPAYSCLWYQGWVSVNYVMHRNLWKRVEMSAGNWGMDQKLWERVHSIPKIANKSTKQR